MQNNVLDRVDSVYDLRRLSPETLPQLALDIRRFIIDIVADKEGHLGASLGVVELTIALHYVFDTPDDQLIWDVGHQAYPHKILTGRKHLFHTNRQKGGLSGFPKRNESIFDAFGTGHSSTSISAALGMAIASKIKGNTDQQHIAVIGDASIASGMAVEGLNHAGVSDANILVILNDNAIGIDPSVGALKSYFAKSEVGRKPARDTIIEALNFQYNGPVDGHNLSELLIVLEQLKNQPGPKFLHVRTTKGKGLRKAEENQVVYHAPGKFNKDTGELLPSSGPNLPPKYQDVFGHTLVDLAHQNTKIVGITPAMPTGSSLKYMMEAFPDRAFDVGIAEQHAVTFAAGLATQGLLPFCTIYSTFLQRAYDQVIHDVAIQNLPVIFCIDRAGLVGADGPTHHGVFDIAFLRCIPNMVIAAPGDEITLRNLLYTASQGIEYPLAIRYPRGRGTIQDWKQPFQTLKIGRGKELQKGKQVAILSIGTIRTEVEAALRQIPSSETIGFYDMIFIKPLDIELLEYICQSYSHIITIEDGTKQGGGGSAILEYASTLSYKPQITLLGIEDTFISHGTTFQNYEDAGISSRNIAEVITNTLVQNDNL